MLQALEAAGCFAMVLECVPPLIAAAATRELNIPTIGIGAGPHCSGQERGSFPTLSSASALPMLSMTKLVVLWGAAGSMTCLQLTIREGGIALHHTKIVPLLCMRSTAHLTALQRACAGQQGIFGYRVCFAGAGVP